MAAQILTRWSVAQDAQQELTADQKHNIVAGYARLMANSFAPWLFPLLDAAGATVYASDGMFLFFLESELEKFHEIPELSALISLIHSREPEEASA